MLTESLRGYGMYVNRESTGYGMYVNGESTGVWYVC